MTRLFVLLLCLCSVASVAQPGSIISDTLRTVVREGRPEVVTIWPKRQGEHLFFTSADTKFLKQYSSWADLARQSADVTYPVNLTLDLYGVIESADWAFLRKVPHVRIVSLELPARLPPVSFDSLLIVLANWPELSQINFSQQSIDLTKSPKKEPVVASQSLIQLPMVQTANFFGKNDDMAVCMELLSHCPGLRRLTVNSLDGYYKPAPIPAALAKLTQLRELRLTSGSGFSGLDSAFAGLTNLTTLYMTNTGDGRKLTKALNHLPRLRRLELRFGITDSDLNELRLEKLVQLDTLDCHFITGTRFPIDSVLAGVTSLRQVTLDNGLLNSLDWMADNQLLQSLDLTGCQFPTPTRSLAKLTQLQTISIDRADSLGQFPVSFTTIPNLLTLSIPDAQLGAIPASIGAMTSLTGLNLYHNNLSSLPAELGKLTALKNLNLGYNQLAAIPASVLRLSSLETLALYENRLTSIPANLGQLPNLLHLYLLGNQIDKLPDEVTRCRKLETLALDNNPLTALPERIGQLNSLQTLSLTGTRLRTLPASMGRLGNLRTLRLSGGRLLAFPSLAGCRQLQRLWLGDSALTTLPGSIGLLPRLTNLNLNLPQLRLLPDGLTSLTNLTNLTIQAAQLLVLPAGLGRLTNLRELTISSHKLLGLPNSLGRLTQLTSLHLNGGTDPSANQPFGALEQLPDSIAFCQNLVEVRITNQQAVDATDIIRKLARLPQLNKVSMTRCGIGSLGDIDWKQVLFKALYLDENNLRLMPEAILDAPNLLIVNLSGNSQLPARLNQIFANKEALRQAISDAKQ